jgi:hypothetical protein
MVATGCLDGSGRIRVTCLALVEGDDKSRGLEKQPVRGRSGHSIVECGGCCMSKYTEYVLYWLSIGLGPPHSLSQSPQEKSAQEGE